MRLHAHDNRSTPPLNTACMLTALPISCLITLFYTFTLTTVLSQYVYQRYRRLLLVYQTPSYIISCLPPRPFIPTTPVSVSTTLATTSHPQLQQYTNLTSH